MIAATLLWVVMIAPDGSQVESVQQFDTRAQCRTEYALARAAMLADPKGYQLVRVDCDPVNVSKYSLQTKGKYAR